MFVSLDCNNYWMELVRKYIIFFPIRYVTLSIPTVNLEYFREIFHTITNQSSSLSLGFSHLSDNDHYNCDASIMVQES